MEKELGKWDDLVVGFIPDEMEQRERATQILKSRYLAGFAGHEEVCILKNLSERDPSGNLRISNKF